MNHDSVRPSCPICRQAIAVPKGESVDRFVSAHIDSGCRLHLDGATTQTSLPTGHAARMNFCSHASCNRNEDVLITCPKCRQSYCLQHRSPLDHQCPRLTPPPQSAPVKTDKPLAKRSVPVQLHKRKFANTVATSYNASKIVEGITVAVFFDAIADANPFYITFQRRNPVGMCLDKMCKAANVPNTNNSATSEAERWYVFCLSSATKMPMEMALDPNMVAEEVAGDGDVLYIGKGPHLPKSVVEEIAAKSQSPNNKKANDSACTVA
eukprot:GDKK01002988.1.p1 GENE.GDKK01002988.1~~GDKK01002988.1.p1  ORF type:complete len:295 (-),score=-1.84 GDKK01002988.1:158-955(-)